MNTDPQADRSHRTVLAVTVTSRPDGGHYIDQADFAAHVAQWVKTDLKGHHAIAEVTVDDQAADSEPHRLALSTALGLGTGAPWDAIRERAAELAGQAVGVDRGAVLREAATIVRSMGSDYALQEAAEHLDGLAVEDDEEREAQAHLDALVPIAEGAPLPDLDGPALYEKLTAMFSGPLPWPPDTRPDLVTLRERIAEDLYAHDHPNWRVPLRDSDVEPVYRERAAAVVAGLRQLVAAVGIPSRLAAETPGPEAQPVRHAPGTAILCPDCHAKGHSVCMDGATAGATADYQQTTGHAITCLAVAGGASDPDCPACHPKFGIDGCTCIPFTRQTDPPRYLNRPTDTVDMISGWEPGGDCPHADAPAVVAEPGKENDRG